MAETLKLSERLQDAAAGRLRRFAPADERVAADVERIAAQCVHCGLCNAACPTYILAGDERDGPRGRITMIASMFARGGPPIDTVRHHVGRCLSCMSCVTACPAGVDYRHLIGYAKTHIRATTSPTAREYLVNWIATNVIPHPRRLVWLMRLGPMVSRLGGVLRWLRLGEIAALAESTPSLGAGRGAFTGPGTAATRRERRGRVVLLAGCAQQVLRPGINDASIRLLARSGIDVEVAAGAGCCGAAAAQAGDPEAARRFARANIDAWSKSIERQTVDAIIINGAGCGTAVKDYPHLLRNDVGYRQRAATIAEKAQDVTEFLAARGLGPPRRWSSLKVAYQAACQLHNGQGVVDEPAHLLHEAGFTVVELPEAYMCCGASDASAFKEKEITDQLRERKIGHIRAARADVVATGSMACLKHLEPALRVPIVHTVELLDWAHGGPVPRGLEALAGEVTDVPGPPPLDLEDYIRA